MIEFALIFPLLLMLLVGIVSAGVAYNHQLSLTHAAREAGRYGATLPVDNLDAWLAELAERAVEEATGSLDPGTPGLVVCVAHVHPDGNHPADETKSQTNGTTGSDPCFEDGRPANERRVQVQVAREANFSVVFFSTDITLGSHAVNRFEAGLGL